ncbi:sulfite exporter TauE/SafE family protein [Bowmanella sp. Y26]|uniref:sulfite exporter TauE/SafE family protein n=1 Tax=Bowmanella yangjiangensis TaxID=2811230 RepID=UPI001BDC1D07|nr:sulfite exporter TauE/SafE family protein [Bowmanella yangjiangensis]MBT1062282.1 sulfite exporter TauE/SafE family protein [Bowmanella yangjiangensis]
MDPLIFLIVSCMLLGCIAGVLAGLLGIGGGLVIVPTLVYLLQVKLGLPLEIVMPMAVATSLSTIIFTGFSSFLTHYKLGNLDMRVFLTCSVGIALGAVLGAQFAAYMPAEMLKRLFAGLMLLLAFRMAFGKNRVTEHSLSRPKLVGIGLGVGSVSSLLGIGGGALLVPALVWFRVAMKTAIGCAAACGMVIALFGSGSFVLAGLGRAGLPEYSLGFVYLPATVAIVSTSMLAANVGAKWGHNLPIATLKKIFAGFLVLVSLQMFLN